MPRNLILTGGLYHPFESASETLRDLLGEVGFESDITTDIHTGLDWLKDGGYDLLTVYTLSHRMKDPRFDEIREKLKFELNEADRTSIESHLQKGRGLLALHTASISFDDWPRWSEIVGAGWIWGASYHPPHGPVSVKMTQTDHPITRGLPGFSFDDEAYSKMDLAPGLEPLAMVQAASQDTPSPCLWVRDVGNARVVYDALGHDSASFEHPTHRTIVQRSALWATGQPLTS